MTADERRLLPSLRAEGAATSLRSNAATYARNYARLLVSDIRLYHEEDVIVGRAARDLATRLEGPIASARAAFSRRFDDDRAFDRELVRILAGGDPNRLGRPIKS